MRNCRCAKCGWLYTTIRWGAAIVFGIILLLLLTIRSSHLNQSVYAETNLLSLLGGLAVLAVVFFCGKALFRRWKWGRAHTGRLVLCLTVLLFLVQLCIAYNLFFYSGWDVQNNNGLALSLSRGDGFSQHFNFYFSRYPNNLLLALLSSLVMKAENSLNLFPASHDGMALVVVNCILLSLTCWMIYSVLRKMTNERYALLGYLLGAVLLGLSPWMVIPYSDVWSVIFPIAALNLFMTNEKTQWHAALKWAGIILLTVTGYLIKPQCAILPLALLIIFALTHITGRGMIQLVCLLLCTATVFSAGQGLVMKAARHHGFEYDPEATLSWPHFLMMGLNPEIHGLYSNDDVLSSAGIETAQERKAFNLTQAAQRAKAMGAKGLADHLRQKMLITFNDGMFWWGMEGSFYKQVPEAPNQRLSPWLRSIMYSTGEHYPVYASVIHAVWITVMLFVFIGALLSPAGKKRLDFSAVLLSLCGFVLFSLLFEVRSRYVITMLPLFIITAVSGIRQIASVLTSRKKTARCIS